MPNASCWFIGCAKSSRRSASRVETAVKIRDDRLNLDVMPAAMARVPDEGRSSAWVDRPTCLAAATGDSRFSQKHERGIQNNVSTVVDAGSNVNTRDTNLRTLYRESPPAGRNF